MSATVTAAALLKQKVTNCINYVEEIIKADVNRMIEEKGGAEKCDKEMLTKMSETTTAFHLAMQPFLSLNENLLFAFMQAIFIDNMDMTEKLMDPAINDADLMTEFKDAMLSVVGEADTKPPSMGGEESFAKLRAYGRCFFALTCNTIEEARTLAASRKEMMAQLFVPRLQAKPSFDKSTGDDDNGPQQHSDGGCGRSEGEHHPGRAGPDGDEEVDGQEEGCGRGEAQGNEGQAQVEDGQ